MDIGANPHCQAATPQTVTCFTRSRRWPAVYEGGSHSSSRSTFMNSSTVSWLVGVSSNSVSLYRVKRTGPQLLSRLSRCVLQPFGWAYT